MKPLSNILEASLDDLCARSRTGDESVAATPDGSLPHRVPEEELSELSAVPEPVEQPERVSGSKGQAQAHWFPLSREHLKGLLTAEERYLKLYCRLVNMRRAREWWGWDPDTYTFHRGYGFIGLAPDTVPFDLEALAGDLGITKKQLKQDLRDLCGAGYLAFVLLEAVESCADGEAVGEEAQQHIEGWEFGGNWRVSAVSLRLPNKAFLKVPEEILGLPAAELVFNLTILLLARYSSKKRMKYYRGKIYEVSRGQFLKTQTELADDTGIDRSRCRRYVKHARQNGIITDVATRGSYRWTVKLP